MQSTTLAYELPLPARDPSMAAAAREPITPIPLHQALEPRRVALGERLFNDVRLSHDDTRACTTCHPLEHGGMDGQPRAIAANGTLYLCNTPLDFTHKNPALVGLGSYIVNSQGGCNDCHTNPPYAEGGDPFLGQPPVVNGEGYLAGGMMFGPFVSHNLTPCQDGKPAGLTLEEFIQGMRTGVDLKDDLLPPGDTPLLQVMPWPVYGLMTNCDLQAIYEYLRAIPPHAGCIPPGVQASDATP